MTRSLLEQAGEGERQRGYTGLWRIFLQSRAREAVSIWGKLRGILSWKMSNRLMFHWERFKREAEGELGRNCLNGGERVRSRASRIVVDSGETWEGEHERAPGMGQVVPLPSVKEPAATEGAQKGLNPIFCYQ